MVNATSLSDRFDFSPVYVSTRGVPRAFNALECCWWISVEEGCDMQTATNVDGTAMVMRLCCCVAVAFVQVIE